MFVSLSPTVGGSVVQVPLDISLMLSYTRPAVAAHRAFEGSWLSAFFEHSREFANCLSSYSMQLQMWATAALAVPSWRSAPTRITCGLCCHAVMVPHRHHRSTGIARSSFGFIFSLSASAGNARHRFESFEDEFHDPSPFAPRAGLGPDVRLIVAGFFSIGPQ